MATEIRTTTLRDAERYQYEMVRRMEKNPAAIEQDHYMTRYILEIIQDRIAEKDKGK